jgi:hypothetical protein
LDVPAADGVAPNRDCTLVDEIERARIGNCRPPVLLLSPVQHQGAGLPTAVGEAAIVKGKYGKAGGGEALAVGVEALVSHKRDRRP